MKIMAEMKVIGTPRKIGLEQWAVGSGVVEIASTHQPHSDYHTRLPEILEQHGSGGFEDCVIEVDNVLMPIEFKPRERHHRCDLPIPLRDIPRLACM